MQSATNIEINKMLDRIFDNSMTLLKSIAPNGWRYSEYIIFFHPTPEQQYEEEKAQIERLNKISKRKAIIEAYDPDKYQQNDLDGISENEEFQHVLGLSVYDIFSDNHEVYNSYNKVFDLGSFRGSGRTIADFLNSKASKNKNYNYMDFYMGTIWIKDRANLLPFYEYIFQILKDESCDWNYCFPRLYLLDLGSKEISESKNLADYTPEEAMANELQKLNDEKKIEKFQDELDTSFQNEYEDAKYKPLVTIVQAYKNIYERLPKGHPQNEFE